MTKPMPKEVSVGDDFTGAEVRRRGEETCCHHDGGGVGTCHGHFCSSGADLGQGHLLQRMAGVRAGAGEELGPGRIRHRGQARSGGLVPVGDRVREQSKSGRVRTASKVWVVHPPLHTGCYMNITAQLVDQTGKVVASISVK
jgi:hypothetical protein